MRDRGLEQRAPGQRGEAAVRLAETGGGARDGARRGADPEHLRGLRREVDADRIHRVRPRAPQPETRDRDEVVEHARRTVVRAVDEHETPRARPRQRALGDPRDECGRNTGVDGVAALLKHLSARLGGELMTCGDGASHGARLLRLRALSSSAAVTRATPVLREATFAAGAAATLAAALVWLAPPGADLAEHAYQRTLFLHDGFALWNNFWYAGRYSFVTYRDRKSTRLNSSHTVISYA